MYDENNNFIEFDPDVFYANGKPISQCPTALSMYAGFVNSNEKKHPVNDRGIDFNPIQAYKDGTLIKTFAECRSDYVGGFLPVGVSCVDVDHRPTANIILRLVDEAVKAGKPPKVRIINTTKGIHIYFKDTDKKRRPTINNFGVLGIGCTRDAETQELVGHWDWRIGGTNFLVIKYKGKEREVIYEPPNGELGELPYWLNIHSKDDFQSVLKYLPFNGKTEGSRNNGLFAHCCTLLRLGYSEKEARGILWMINQCAFAEPLENREVDSIVDSAMKYAKENAGKDNKGSTNIEITTDTTADEVFDSLSDAEKKPKKWEKVVEFLTKNYIFANINGACYVYIVEKGIYRLLTLEVVDEMILDSFGGSIKLSDTELKNAKRQLYTNVRKTCPTMNLAEGCVPFANGDYMLADGSFHEFNPERAVLSRLPHNKPTCDVAPEFVVDSLTDWADGDEDTRKLLVQIIAFCLTGLLDSIQQCVLLLGDKQNGKTMFQRLLEHIVGAENCAHLSMKDLSERFRSSELCGKRLNCCDELNSKYIEDTEKFKQLTGRGAITIEKKGKDAISYMYDGVMVFASNDMPRLKDDTGAVLRRLAFVNFTHTFVKNDKFAKEMVKSDNIQGYIHLALKEARILYNEEVGFIEPAKSNPLIEEFKTLADPTGGWLEEITEDDVVGKLVGEVFQRYRSYALERGYKVMSDKSLGKLIRKKFKVENKRRWDKNVKGTVCEYVRV